MTHRITVSILALAALAPAACRDATAPRPTRPAIAASLIPSGEYTAIDLGSIGQPSYALGINNAGQIAGEMIAGGQWRPFLWQNGVMTDLLAGQPYTWGQAFAINDFGVVAAAVDGYASLIADGTVVPFAPGLAFGISNATANPQSASLVGRDGGYAWLWTLQSSTRLCPGEAREINRSGVVVVMCDFGVGVWDAGLLTMIPSLDEAFAVNDAGQVAGSAWVAPGVLHAVRWDHGVATDLGTLGGPWSRGFGINNLGHVVGRADRPDGTQGAFVWKNGVMTELPGGGWTAHSRDINDAGHVAGYIDGRATLWRRLQPVEQVEQIASAVATLLADGSIDRGEARSLGAKLDVATAMLNDGKPGPAANQLQAFINQVEALVRSGRLTAEQGQELIAAAGGVVGRIQG